MTGPSIIIVGGGIAGLSAGCYARMNGFPTRLFEMHDKTGGLCTSWTRQGYTVDGCIHWLVGSSPGSGFHRIWEELGAVQGTEFIYQDEYGRLEGADGRTFVIYSDLGRLERHMKEVAPEDAGTIDEFIAAARRCTRFEPPLEKAPEVCGLFDLTRMVVTQFPMLRMLWKWNRISLRAFGARFKDPLIAQAFPLMFLPDFPMSFMLMTFAWMHNKAAGYPAGGSLAFSRAIERRYRSLGGELHCGARVRRILTENGRATGVELENGSVHRAEYVISAADGHATIFEMLEGKYVDDTIRGYYTDLIPFPPLVYVALGVARTFDDVAHSVGGTAIQLKEPIVIGGVRQEYVTVHAHNFDPSLAPAGKTLLTVMFPADYDFWKSLRQDPERYNAEKERVADAVVALLDNRFPGLAREVEMRDVASPTTFERYTGNWKGSFEGWQVTPETWSFGRLMRKTLPGLRNFYLAGHWVEPGGGLPAVALSGRNVIQIICRKEKRTFRTAR